MSIPTNPAEPDRERFEDRVFSDYFIRSVKRNPNPPRGTGALDFIATAAKTKAELCERDGESYKDEAIGAIWHGWKLALGALEGAQAKPAPDRDFGEFATEHVLAWIDSELEEADAHDPTSGIFEDRAVGDALRWLRANLFGLKRGAQAKPAEPLTVEFIEQHIGPDEGDRDAVLAIVREVEHAHGIMPAFTRANQAAADRATLASPQPAAPTLQEFQKWWDSQPMRTDEEAPWALSDAKAVAWAAVRRFGGAQPAEVPALTPQRAALDEWLVDCSLPDDDDWDRGYAAAKSQARDLVRAALAPQLALATPPEPAAWIETDMLEILQRNGPDTICSAYATETGGLDKPGPRTPVYVGAPNLANGSWATNWLTNGAELHPLTANLVVRFARALAQKLAIAEKKYGFTDGWRDTGWMDDCRARLKAHVAKGDPRDVAAYCAFLWHHGASTVK